MILKTSLCSPIRCRKKGAAVSKTVVLALAGTLGQGAADMEGVLEKLEWHKWTKGMSFERLGEAMGKDPEQLMDWLGGRHKPFRKSLNMIATFLDNQQSPHQA